MCYRPIKFGSHQFACGHCDECRLSQELTLGYYGVCNLTRFDKIASITLTYDDRNVPLMYNQIEVDDETKTYRVLSDCLPGCAIDSPSCSYGVEREVWLKRQGKSAVLRKSACSSRLLEIANDYEYEGAFLDLPLEMSHDNRNVISGLFAVGDIRHLQNWFKKFREYAKRLFGVKDNAFCYTAALEYGPETCRPHFHVCLFCNNEIPDTFLHAMISPYKRPLRDKDGNLHFITGWMHGKINTCNIKNAYDDTTDTFRMAKYVAKYAKKAEKGVHLYERLHLVPTYRRCTSKGYNQAGKEYAKKQILYDIDTERYPLPFDDETGDYHLDELFTDERLIDDATKIVRRMEAKYPVNGSKQGVSIPYGAIRDLLAKPYEECVGVEQYIQFQVAADDLPVCEENRIRLNTIASQKFTLKSLKRYEPKVYDVLLNYKDLDYDIITIPILGKPHYRASLLWHGIRLIQITKHYGSSLEEFRQFCMSRSGNKNIDALCHEFGVLKESTRIAESKDTFETNGQRYTEPSSTLSDWY